MIRASVVGTVIVTLAAVWFLGCAGEDGSVGPAGPAGPGSLMASSSTSAAASIGAACTNLLAVTISVPSAGTVVVETQAWLVIDHTSGTRDLANLLTSDNSASCGAVSPYASAVDVPTSEPTATEFHAVFLQRPFPVVVGAHTFYFNGVMSVGQNAGDMLQSANMIAVFYPD